MKIQKFPLLLLVLLTLTACRPRTTPILDPSQQIATAVAATLTAMPTGTACPLPSPPPPPTPLNLNGLFCEYGFCIGHPEYLPFFDLNAASEENRIPSTYASGKLIAYNTDALLLLIWQTGITDLQYMLNVATQAVNGTLAGSLDVRLIGPYNVFYQPIQPPANSTIPYGGVAAWQCGKRAFAWLAYTSQAETALYWLESALARFTCGE
jgi:hypothetical protein